MKKLIFSLLLLCSSVDQISAMQLTDSSLEDSLKSHLIKKKKNFHRTTSDADNRHYEEEMDLGLTNLVEDPHQKGMGRAALSEFEQERRRLADSIELHTQHNEEIVCDYDSDSDEAEGEVVKVKNIIPKETEAEVGNKLALIKRLRNNFRITPFFNEIFSIRASTSDVVEIAKIHYIKFINKKFAIEKEGLKQIKELWDNRAILKSKYIQDGSYTFKIDHYLEGLTNNPDDVQTFIDLIIKKKEVSKISIEELIKQLKISDKLNSQLALECAQELINKIGNEYTDTSETIIQTIMRELPQDLRNYVLKPLLATKFAQKLNPLCSVATLTGHTRYVSCICRLDANHMISGSSDKTLRAWSRAEDNEFICTQILRGHTGYVRCIFKLDDTHIITAANDRTLKVWVWNADYGWTCTQTLTGHTGSVFGICKLDHAHIISGSYDGTLRVWAKNNDDTWTCKQILNEHSDLVICFCVLNDANIVSGSADKTLIVWTQNGNGKWICAQRLIGHTGVVDCACKLDADHIMSGSRDRTLKVWTWNGYEWICTQTLRGHTRSIWHICKLNNNCVMSGSDDGTLRIWTRSDNDEWICTQTLTGHTGSIERIYKFDANCVISGSRDNNLRVWTRNNDKWICTQTLTGHTGCMECICRLNDINIISGSWDKTMRIWDLDPTSELDFEQTAFCLTLEKQYSDTTQTIQFSEHSHDSEFFRSFPVPLQKRIQKLGWAELEAERQKARQQ